MVLFLAGRGDLSVVHSVLPTQPDIQSLPTTHSLEVKYPGREAGHSTSVAEVTNMWRYTSITPVMLV